MIELYSKTTGTAVSVPTDYILAMTPSASIIYHQQNTTTQEQDADVSHAAEQQSKSPLDRPSDAPLADNLIGRVPIVRDEAPYSRARTLRTDSAYTRRRNASTIRRQFLLRIAYLLYNKYGNTTQSISQDFGDNWYGSCTAVREPRSIDFL